MTHLYSPTVFSSLLLPSLFKFSHQPFHHLFTMKYNPLYFIFKDLHNLETPSYHTLFMIKCQLTPQMDAPLFVIFPNKLHAISQTWEEFLRNIFRAVNCYHISSLPLKFCIMMLTKNVTINLTMYLLLLHINLANIVSQFLHLSTSYPWFYA